MCFNDEEGKTSEAVYAYSLMNTIFLRNADKGLSSCSFQQNKWNFFSEEKHKNSLNDVS